MLRLLLVNIYFRPDPTGTGWLLSELADSLASAGHELSVITAQTHYGLTKRNGVVPGPAVDAESYPVRRTWVFRPSRMTPARRMLNYASFSALASKAMLREQKPDAILTTWPTLAVMAVSSHARRWRVPLVLNLQDIAPSNFPVSGLALRANRWIERSALRRVDHVVTLTDTMRRRCVSCGVRDDRISIIPNWVDTREITPRTPSESMRRELAVGDRFVALAPGNVGLYAGYDAILDAACLLQARPDIVFVLAGQGHGRSDVEQRIEREALTNVRLIPPVPREKFPALLSCADIGIVSRDAAFVDESVPYRALPLMAAGKPIIALTHHRNEVARVVRERGLGLHIDPRKPGELASVLARLADEPADLAPWGMRARQHAEAHHDREAASERYIEVIASACEERAR